MIRFDGSVRVKNPSIDFCKKLMKCFFAVQYVFDDLLNYVHNQPDAEFLDEAQNYWEDHFDDVVEEVEEYADCDFKKDRRSFKYI